MKKRYLFLIILLFISVQLFPSDITNIAILDLKATYGLNQGEVKILTDRLRDALVQIQIYKVIERAKMEQILNEMSFQLSGCTSDACAVEVGELLNVNGMIAGSIGKIGETYSISIRLIDVETSMVVLSISDDYSGRIDGLLKKMEEIASLLSDRSDKISKFELSRDDKQLDKNATEKTKKSEKIAPKYPENRIKSPNIVKEKRRIDIGKKYSSLKILSFLNIIDKAANPLFNSNYIQKSNHKNLYIRFMNKSLFESNTILNNYQFLNTDEFVGDVKAPLFPNFYLAFKTGKLAFSAGFEPIGGGGSANFEKGLPSFELPVSDLVPGLAAEGQPVSAYSLDAAFVSSSICYGFQAGISYKVNDMISIGLGGRYVAASNSYIGHLKDIAINLGGNWTPATTFFTGAATQYTNAATGATTAVTGLNAAVTAGQVLTSTPLAAMDADSSLINGLIAFGLDPTGYTVGNAIAAYTGAATSAGTSAAEMTAKSTLLADQEVDVTQKATGITPIISVFLTPFDGLDISFRYEGLTELELVNEADADKQALVGFEADGTPIYQFPDGAKTNADMPAMMAVGVAYKVMPALRAEFNLNYYMNSGVNWGGREDDVKNGYEVGVAVEYCLNDKLKASVGFLNADGGANPAYQTDLSYSLKSNTIGLGIAYAVSPNLIVNVGGLNTFYQEDEKSFTHFLGITDIPVVEKYMKTKFVLIIGFEYNL